jgi:hypothetical protein
MSILGRIMNAIFGNHAEAATPASTPEADGGATSSSSAAAVSNVDVAAILDKAVARKKEKLTWRTSIVDLMKALDVDSSQTARKELAEELKYSGDTSDSAAMNVWLHGSTRSQWWQAAARSQARMKRHGAWRTRVASAHRSRAGGQRSSQPDDLIARFVSNGDVFY